MQTRMSLHIIPTKTLQYLLLTAQRYSKFLFIYCPYNAPPMPALSIKADPSHEDSLKRKLGMSKGLFIFTLMHSLHAATLRPSQTFLSTISIQQCASEQRHS